MFNNNELIMRKALYSDIEAITDLYTETIDWLNSKGIHQWNKKIYPTKASAMKALQENNLYCYIYNGNISGSFIINEKQPHQYTSVKWRYNTGRILVLHTLIVKPDIAQHGHGKKIMNYIIEYAMNNKYASIRLDVFPENPAAVRLYQNLGFEYAGKVFFDIKEPGYEWYDCYEMNLL